jgi:hypothetical protein
MSRKNEIRANLAKFQLYNSKADTDDSKYVEEE